MTNLYFGNAFSINMLSASITLSYIKINKNQVKEEILNNPDFNIIPCVGHLDTAHVVQNEVDTDIQLFNRISVQPDFNKGDILLVAQYTGSRLPECATTLPEGASINYWLVRK